MAEPPHYFLSLVKRTLVYFKTKQLNATLPKASKMRLKEKNVNNLNLCQICISVVVSNGAIENTTFLLEPFRRFSEGK